MIIEKPQRKLPPLHIETKDELAINDSLIQEEDSLKTMSFKTSKIYSMSTKADRKSMHSDLSFLDPIYEVSHPFQSNNFTSKNINSRRNYRSNSQQLRKLSIGSNNCQRSNNSNNNSNDNRFHYIQDETHQKKEMPWKSEIINIDDCQTFKIKMSKKEAEKRMIYHVPFIELNLQKQAGYKHPYPFKIIPLKQIATQADIKERMSLSSPQSNGQEKQLQSHQILQKDDEKQLSPSKNTPFSQQRWDTNCIIQNSYLPLNVIGRENKYTNSLNDKFSIFRNEISFDQEFDTLPIVPLSTKDVLLSIGNSRLSQRDKSKINSFPKCVSREFNIKRGVFDITRPRRVPFGQHLNKSFM